MIKKYRVYSFVIMIMFCMLFTGCGDRGEETVYEKEGTTTADDTADTLESSDNDIESIREQRDLLEQRYRLYGDVKDLNELQSLIVNLEEEDETIRREAQTMLQNLELEDYIGEAIHMISSKEWMDVMVPNLLQGRRNYFMAKNGTPVLVIQAGFTENGEAYSNVWNHSAENRITLLAKSENMIKLLYTGFSAGKYEGDFTLWSMNGKEGVVAKVQGTFAQNAFTGECTVQTAKAPEGTFFDWWNNRDGMEYKTDSSSLDDAVGSIAEYPVFSVYEGKEAQYQPTSEPEPTPGDGDDIEWSDDIS